MRRRTIGILLALVIGVSAGTYWGTFYVLASKPKTTVLSVQEYAVTTSPQGNVIITKMYYYIPDHALVIQASSDPNVAVNQVVSDARTYNMTGFAISSRATWFIIPGWNCGYSNDNGRAETTQLVISTGATYSLEYSCIFPPTMANVTFTGLVAPVHTPCTYVGSQPASCTSLVD